MKREKEKGGRERGGKGEKGRGESADVTERVTE
jgi:hypothetical protein